MKREIVYRKFCKFYLQVMHRFCCKTCAFLKESDLELRLEALEKKVYKTSKLEKKEETDSGPAEIRTQDLRRVKATS